MSRKSKLANSVKSRRESEWTKDRDQIFECDQHLTVGFLAQYLVNFRLKPERSTVRREDQSFKKIYMREEKKKGLQKVYEEVSEDNPFLSFGSFR